MEETNTIKGKEVIAYKGMEYDMTCKGFHYETGKTYKTDKAELCECGFHACLNPREVLGYYDEDNLRYFKVLLSGEITKCKKFDTKVAATEITILEEITDRFDEICKNVDWWKNKGVLDFLYYQEGFAVIRREDGLYNFIDKKGKLLFDEWLDYWSVYNFYNSFAIVKRKEDELYNLIDTNGKLLSDDWFYWCYRFSDGFARVQRKDKSYNYINKEGKLLSDDWFYWCEDFSDGFARVQRGDGLYNLIDNKGKLLSDEWFYAVDDFNGDFAEVQRTNREWCKIDKTGKLIKNLQ